ncbi:hypothetical protein AGR1B_pa0218 [Agrobacterium fabacearum S56]|nr:hypothetical protein AGR1B_pa0218 [Agrobacterium fabacearum S56]
MRVNSFEDGQYASPDAIGPLNIKGAQIYGGVFELASKVPRFEISILVSHNLELLFYGVTETFLY